MTGNIHINTRRYNRPKPKASPKTKAIADAIREKQSKECNEAVKKLNREKNQKRGKNGQ